METVWNCLRCCATRSQEVELPDYVTVDTQGYFRGWKNAVRWRNFVQLVTFDVHLRAVIAETVPVESGSYPREAALKFFLRYWFSDF